MAKKRISVIRETNTGRNMARQQFVKAIKQGVYSNYHVRVINGVETPVPTQIAAPITVWADMIVTDDPPLR